MPLSSEFPRDPHEVISPELRWYPGAQELAEDDASRLIPPLVAEIRRGVHAWRQAGYPDVSQTSRALLQYWFETAHVQPFADGGESDFRYFFAQREAVETAVWLFENQHARDPYNLMRYDASGLVSKAMFPESWTRYVFKLATGAGKTKVLSLLIAWSYFHRLYEHGSPLSQNFLVIAPNIIVLDRLMDDFAGLKIFFEDPIIPQDGHLDRKWRADFQPTLHVQDEIGPIATSGNIFVTNIHRIYSEKHHPSLEDENLTDYFLGARPITKTVKSTVDVGQVIRAVDDLVILNDEAHHIHDEGLAWFRAIQDIDSGIRRRTGHGISAQFDVTATPKDQNGGIFVQTVCSYPLVEAIRQGVVKTPVVPDEPSRARLVERPSDKVSERYADHLKLGYLEWAKRREELERCGRKPVLFVMTTTTAESDEVAAYMERTFPDLTGKVLTIHTKANGDLDGAPGDRELEALREASRRIDSADSPYLCVVSVLMLREGWDVQNVIAMVGLRPFTAKSKVLPEQTLGRGLRRMFRGEEVTEYVSVVGTEAFLDFVESVRSEGVDLESVPMSNQSAARKPLLVEVDALNPEKDIEGLDISLPKLSSRVERQLRRLEDLDLSSMKAGHFEVREFTDEQQREIVFLDLDTEERAWTTDLGEAIIPSPQAVITYLVTELMHRVRLVGGAAVLYEKMKAYITSGLFEGEVDVSDPNVLRNLSEIGPRRHLYEEFARAINALTLTDEGTAEMINEIKISRARPVLVNHQEYIESKKTLFNRVVGDSHLELRFAAFLDRMSDVQAFVKNMRSLHFSMEYISTSGELRYYYPDFVVRTLAGEIFIVETKGLEDLDVAPKWRRLVQWCTDATRLSADAVTYTPLFVSEEAFDDLEATATGWNDFVSVARRNRPTGVGDRD